LMRSSYGGSDSSAGNIPIMRGTPICHHHTPGDQTDHVGTQRNRGVAYPEPDPVFTPLRGLIIMCSAGRSQYRVPRTLDVPSSAVPQRPLPAVIWGTASQAVAGPAYAETTLLHWVNCTAGAR
jgi:hypothetical protein